MEMEDENLLLNKLELKVKCYLSEALQRFWNSLKINHSFVRASQKYVSPV